MYFIILYKYFFIEPAAPYNFNHEVSNNFTQVTLAWDSTVKRNATYRVRYRLANANDSIDLVVKERFIIIGNLSSNSTYEFRVGIEESVNGSSRFSPVYAVVTREKEIHFRGKHITNYALPVRKIISSFSYKNNLKEVDLNIFLLFTFSK